MRSYWENDGGCYMVFSNINTKHKTVLEKIFRELSITIERQEWKNKQNQYVSFDYEPFCVEGFYLEMVCRSDNKQMLDFANYLYTKWVNDTTLMEKCLNVTV